jgi:hypothetical protein
MQTRTTDAFPLARRPNLDHYRTLAKNLLKAARATDGAAVRGWATDWLRRLARSERMTPSGERTAVSIDRHSNDAALARDVQGILDDIGRSRLGKEGTDHAGRRTLSEAQLVVARLHGFESWPKFVHHLESRAKPTTTVAKFERAADAIVDGDIETLDALLRANSGLVHARSTRDHNATLLHYVAANGHEGFRQRSPKNAVQIARRLLEAGAKPDATAAMYGHRCTTMEMLVSSEHPHATGVQVELVELLLDYGAAPDGVEDDGSPLMTALRFHYPRAAHALAARGARIDNVIAAAALGRTDLIERFVDDGGALKPGARLPDVPWPKLPPDPAIHLAYALTWASALGQREAVELLLRKGVDASAADSDASAAHFAAAHGHMDIVRALLRHGASLETRNSYGGTVLDGTIWYARNAPIEGVDYGSVVRALLALGARVDVYPELEEHVAAVLAGRHRRAT